MSQPGSPAWPSPIDQLEVYRSGARVNETPDLRLCEVVDGGSASFEDAFRAEYPGVVRVLAPIVGSVADAEAIAQDAFIKAYGRWRRIGGYDRPAAWIRRVAIRDAVRFARRHPPVAGDLGTGPDATGGVADRIDLERALMDLSPNQRVCVVLYHLADWPVPDVAEALGCAEATVRVHLHRGRQALAAALTTETAEVADGRR